MRPDQPRKYRVRVLQAGVTRYTVDLNAPTKILAILDVLDMMKGRLETLDTIECLEMT